VATDVTAQEDENRASFHDVVPDTAIARLAEHCGQSVAMLPSTDAETDERLIRAFDSAAADEVRH
jgi:hypothetical protein